ncbi:uncharacterized protein LOC111829910 [Capsella rubella]|uniref:uncharacterized protein LOC111829910 n=1 Tax=Capsella rubella TaxID=81985 RepID=UPI000CD57704|nr:uncharacterized protein LOC111829910 [Capsella rubella]
MWFVYGGHPIRFSMRGFAILTGLNCNPYPPEQEIEKMQTPRRKDETYWTKLFGPHSSMSIRDIVDWLKRDKRLPKPKRMDGQKRLRLALLVIVEGILVCDSSNVRASRKVVQMLEDINSFDSFPWGRLSFERTMVTVSVGSVNKSADELAQKLMQSHTATHGFTLAIQLLILQAVPLLQNYLLGPDDSETFAFRSVSQLTMCKTFHNSTILETELDEKLQVESILKMDHTLELGTITWGDEVEDERVDFLCEVIKDGHIFKAESWHGGFSNLPSMVKSAAANVKREPGAATAPNQKKPAPTKRKAKSGKTTPPVDDEPPINGPVPTLTAQELLDEIDRRNHEHTAKIEHANLLDEINKSAWPGYGPDIVDILRSINGEAVEKRDVDMGGSTAPEDENAVHNTDSPTEVDDGPVQVSVEEPDSKDDGQEDIINCSQPHTTGSEEVTASSNEVSSDNSDQGDDDVPGNPRAQEDKNANLVSDGNPVDDSPVHRPASINPGLLVQVSVAEEDSKDGGEENTSEDSSDNLGDEQDVEEEIDDAVVEVDLTDPKPDMA